MFPTYTPKETSPTREEFAQSIGHFILLFGKVEYSLVLLVAEIDRIIDGTTNQKNFPYSFDEMCKFVRKSASTFLPEAEVQPLEKIIANLADLNGIRTVLVHSYLSGSEEDARGKLFRFERFASVKQTKNSRKLIAYLVRKEFIDDSAVDLGRVRSLLIKSYEKLRTAPEQPRSDSGQ